jgi:hypothetical protein
MQNPLTFNQLLPYWLMKKHGLSLFFHRFMLVAFNSFSSNTCQRSPNDNVSSSNQKHIASHRFALNNVNITYIHIGYSGCYETRLFIVTHIFHFWCAKDDPNRQFVYIYKIIEHKNIIHWKKKQLKTTCVCFNLCHIAIMNQVLFMGNLSCFFHCTIKHHLMQLQRSEKKNITEQENLFLVYRF